MNTPSPTTTTTTTKERIKQELLKRHIHLWKPPYYGVRDATVHKQELAESFVDVATTELADNNNNNNNNKNTPQQQVLACLEEFQHHALDKLARKGKLLRDLQIKVLDGSSVVVAPVLVARDTEDNPEQQRVVQSCFAVLAERVEQTTTTNANNNNSTRTLQLHNVNPDLTVADLCHSLALIFQVSVVRLVCKGKTATATAAATTADAAATAATATARLSDWCGCHNIVAAASGSGSTKGGYDGSAAAKILCLLGNKNNNAMAGSTAAAASLSSNNNTNNDGNDNNNDGDDERLIHSIRQAAAKLQQSSSSNGLDITDAAGNHVSMTQTDRLAFLTALGLHALGQQRMNRQQTQQTQQQQSQQQHQQDCPQASLVSALVFLLQADEEWNKVSEEWKSRVDNYGLLQLDICWVYLQLEGESMEEDLSNVSQRLERAERVLRQQVHSNFVTLALVQAEMGKPCPAVAAIFVRLFLLQGVVYRYCVDSRGNSNSDRATKSKERLDWAWAVAKSLRAVSPPDSIACLCDAVQATPFEAISALRRTNGQVDQAADLIVQDRTDAIKANKQRVQQNEFGLCGNGQDYVDLNLFEQLKTVLDISADDQLIGGLLRLSNNNFDRALELYQQVNRSSLAIAQRVMELDSRQGVSRSRKRDREDVQVDEMSLASLISMGVERSLAQRALRKSSNNVELALLWLTSSPCSTMMIPPMRHDNDDAASLPPALNQPLGVSADSVHQHTTAGQRQETAVNFQEIMRDREEKEVVELLERVLGEVLREQGKNNGCLGNSLDEEWAYIEKYRQA